MAKKKPKQTRKPGGGRKPKFGEPTQSITVRLTASAIEILDLVGPSRNAAVERLIRESIQYRLRYGSGEPLDCE